MYQFYNFHATYYQQLRKIRRRFCIPIFLRASLCGAYFIKQGSSTRPSLRRTTKGRITSLYSCALNAPRTRSVWSATCQT